MHAARHSPWLILRDLDHDAACAPDLLDRLLEIRPRLLCLRIPVRTVDAWLLADAGSIARSLQVRKEHVPTEPEVLARPKRTLVDLARRSRSFRVRDDLTPIGRSEVGPGYSSWVIRFATERWNPEAAAQRSPSLRRAIAALRRLREPAG